jgi:N-acetylneuraminate synthase
LTEAIKVGNRKIGRGHPTFIIAELGYNFRTLDEALSSVDAAAECGADALKVQTFTAETITTQSVDFPEEAGGVNQFDEFKEYEISEDDHRAIFERCRDRNLIPFSTPSYQDDVALLERLEVPIHKLGSDDLTNLPFLEYVAEVGKPIIFSSGMATLGEVDRAIQVFHNAGNRDLILLQCVSNYPIEDVSQLDLNVIRTYGQAFPVLVGLSDHTQSNVAAIAAVALGASVVEKHFVLDKQMPVPDAFFSADPAEMKALVEAVRETEQMLGAGHKVPSQSEKDMRVETRKSVIARRYLPKDHTITPDDVIVKRPGHGIDPSLLSIVVGRKTRVAIPVDTPIEWPMV